MGGPTAHAPAGRRRSTASLRAALIDAAESEFANHGFAAASTRAIAERAGAHQPQINYHFSSKGQLWKATVDRLFEELDATLFGGPVAAPDPSVFAESIGRFLRFSADRPALNRIINLEASAPSARLDWLVVAHLAPHFDLVADAWRRLRSVGEGADLTVEEVWEIITSFGALHFANAPLLSKLGQGHAVPAELQIERTLRLLALHTEPGQGRESVEEGSAVDR